MSDCSNDAFALPRLPCRCRAATRRRGEAATAAAPWTTVSHEELDLKRWDRQGRGGQQRGTGGRREGKGVGLSPHLALSTPVLPFSPYSPLSPALRCPLPLPCHPTPGVVLSLQFLFESLGAVHSVAHVEASCT